MGDRSQVAIKMGSGTSKVYLYGHWKGEEIYRDVARALSRRERWSDPEYLARIIFCEMVKGHETEETGFGIGTSRHGDIEHPIMVLDCDKQKITWELNEHKFPNMTFQQLVDEFSKPQKERQQLAILA